MFTSDNERGIAALAGGMSGMGVEVISVGPGQHDHTIERMIRHLKEVIRATKHSLPFLLLSFLFLLLSPHVSLAFVFILIFVSIFVDYFVFVFVFIFLFFYFCLFFIGG